MLSLAAQLLRTLDSQHSRHSNTATQVCVCVCVCVCACVCARVGNAVYDTRLHSDGGRRRRCTRPPGGAGSCCCPAEEEGCQVFAAVVQHVARGAFVLPRHQRPDLGERVDACLCGVVANPSSHARRPACLGHPRPLFVCLPRLHRPLWQVPHDPRRGQEACPRPGEVCSCHSRRDL